MKNYIINEKSNIENIKEIIDTYNKKSQIEFDIIWFDNITKIKITYIIEKLFKKYNVEKYIDDITYIIMELISNAVKARYLHIISIKTLEKKFPKYKEKIENYEYFQNDEIMNKYSDIFLDKDTKKELKNFIRLENKLIKDLDNKINIDVEKCNKLLEYKNTVNKFEIKLIISFIKNYININIINNSPLIMINRARIDSKRLIFKEYYTRNIVDKFFIEQIDNIESAGFGLALCDLRLLNQNLIPEEHLKIYDKNNQTYSQLIIPIKKEFGLIKCYNKY